jgi:uncharacterized membrane protein
MTTRRNVVDAIWNQIVENARRVAAQPWARQLVADQKRVFFESVIRLLEEKYASEPERSRRPRSKGRTARRGAGSA